MHQPQSRTPCIRDLTGLLSSPLQVQARKEERELVITGERPAPKRTDGQEGQFRSRIERRFGKFSRTFTVRASLMSQVSSSHFVEDHAVKLIINSQINCFIAFPFYNGNVHLHLQ